jgi:hypothetical protein
MKLWIRIIDDVICCRSSSLFICYLEVSDCIKAGRFVLIYMTCNLFGIFWYGNIEKVAQLITKWWSAMLPLLVLNLILSSCNYERGQKNQRSSFLFSLFLSEDISVSTGKIEIFPISRLHIVLHLFTHSGWYNLFHFFKTLLSDLNLSSFLTASHCNGWRLVVPWNVITS